MFNLCSFFFIFFGTTEAPLVFLFKSFTTKSVLWESALFFFEKLKCVLWKYWSLCLKSFLFCFVKGWPNYSTIYLQMFGEGTNSLYLLMLREDQSKDSLLCLSHLFEVPAVVSSTHSTATERTWQILTLFIYFIIPHPFFRSSTRKQLERS